MQRRETHCYDDACLDLLLKSVDLHADDVRRAATCMQRTCGEDDVVYVVWQRGSSTQPRHGRSLGMDAASDGPWTGHATRRAVRPTVFCNCAADDDELHVVVDHARHDLRGDAEASADAREGKKGPTAALLHACL